MHINVIEMYSGGTRFRALDSRLVDTIFCCSRTMSSSHLLCDLGFFLESQRHQFVSHTVLLVALRVRCLEMTQEESKGLETKFNTS